MQKAIEKSVEEDKKSDYYANKIKTIENNKVISSDDPKVIEKLQEKLNLLEEQKEQIKAREHKTYELTNLNAEIRRIKKRIADIQKLEELNFKDIKFEGGKVVYNKEQNRLQFIFDYKPDEEIRNILKENSFKWDRSQGAWQRLYNQNGIFAVKRVIKQLRNKCR